MRAQPQRGSAGAQEQLACRRLALPIIAPVDRLHLRLVPAAALCALACTPTFDWREVAVGDLGLQALFPCKPQRTQRPAQGASGGSELLSCRADAWTFAVAHSHLTSAAEAPQALAAMRSALAANAGGAEIAMQPMAFGTGTGMDAMRVTVRGRSPDGAPVEVQAQLFARGERVVQASVVGSGSLPAEVAANFFEGLRWEYRR